MVVVRDKEKLDIEGVRKKINKCLKRNFYYIGREWPYKDVKTRIIAEKYMEDASEGELRDYKFFCFNGIPKLVYISHGLENHSTAEISFYDLDGVEKDFRRSDFAPYHNAEVPQNFSEMKKLSYRLAAEIPSDFVRIDLYSIDSHIYFSEITFSPCSGFLPFEPSSADEKLGKELLLSTTMG